MTCLIFLASFVITYRFSLIFFSKTILFLFVFSIINYFWNLHSRVKLWRCNIVKVILKSLPKLLTMTQWIFPTIILRIFRAICCCWICVFCSWLNCRRSFIIWSLKPKLSDLLKFCRRKYPIIFCNKYNIDWLCFKLNR